MKNGAELFGRAPHIAPMAWLHSIYRGLLAHEIQLLEVKIGIPFDANFKKFLTVTNGLNVFNTTFNIYGSRTNYIRDDENVWQPFDIATINKEERPLNSKKDYLFIGGYDWDGSEIFISADGTTFRCERDDAKIIYNSWDNFNEMLKKEIPRLIILFDEKGKQINPNQSPVPGNV